MLERQKIKNVERFPNDVKGKAYQTIHIMQQTAANHQALPEKFFLSTGK